MTDAFRLPHTVRPRRYDLMVRPDLDASTFSGTVRIALDVAEATDSIVLHARDLDVELGVIRQDGTIRAGRPPDRARQRAHRLRARPRAHAGARRARAHVLRRDQPRHARLLPQHVRRRRRPRTRAGRNPVRGPARPRRVPVLRRARVQGGVRRHPRGPRRPARALQRAGDRTRGMRRRPRPCPVRRHDLHVDVSRCVGRGSAGAVGARRRGRGRRARRARPRQGSSHGVRARRRVVRDHVLRRLLRHPLPRREVRPRRTARLLLRRDGEPRPHHVPRDATAARSRAGHTRRDGGRRARRSCTRSPTCGSATS